MKLRSKLLIALLAVSVVIYVMTIGYFSYSLRKHSIQEAKSLADTYAEQKANEVKSRLNEDMGIARSMAQSLKNIQKIPYEIRGRVESEVLGEVLKGNPQYDGTWLSWELSTVDSLWTLPYGRKRITYFKEGGNLVQDIDTLDTAGDNINGIYYRIKISKKEELTEPYPYEGYKDSTLTILGSSVCIPIVNNGHFLGLIGSDFSLSSFSSITEISDFENSYAFLTSNNGALVAHPNQGFINRKLDELKLTDDENLKLLKNVREGRGFSFEGYDSATTEKLYVSIKPIEIGRSELPWAIGMVVPYKEITKAFDEILTITIALGIIGLAVLVFILWRVVGNVTFALNNVNHELEKLASGEVDNKSEIVIGKEEELAAISNLVIRLRSELQKKADFSEKIGSGELETSFELSSEKDHLGKSLLSMRDSLKKSNNDDQIRRWNNEGVANFGELLRDNTDDMKEWGANLISEMVKYLKANQGGLYIINDDNQDDKFLELMGSYAYDRRKFINKRLELEEGVIGHAILEKKEIYLEEIPQEFVDITSGLGKATPTCLIVVPMISNDEVYGAFELASFNKLEPHEISFLMRLGESIGSHVSSIKINQRTKFLLEETQTNAEEMKAQEEEMRQNMEELQATQEEMGRKTNESEQIMDDLKIATTNLVAILDGMADGVVVFDKKGKIEDVNKKFEALYNNSKNKIEGKNVFDIFNDGLGNVPLNEKVSLSMEAHNLGQKVVHVIKTSILKASGEKYMLTISE